MRILALFNFEYNVYVDILPIRSCHCIHFIESYGCGQSVKRAGFNHESATLWVWEREEMP